MKTKQEAIEELKRKLNELIEIKKKNRSARIKFNPPLYDDVYYEALAHFEELDRGD